MTETKELTAVESKSWEEALENESWVAPLVDIYETEDDYYLTTSLPGVEKENVKIKVEEGNLIIMGRIDFEGERNKKYILKEIDSSNFYRKFKISDSVDDNKINAKFENGRLEIHLPKMERMKPKKIEIK